MGSRMTLSKHPNATFYCDGSGNADNLLKSALTFVFASVLALLSAGALKLHPFTRSGRWSARMKTLANTRVTTNMMAS